MICIRHLKSKWQKVESSKSGDDVKLSSTKSSDGDKPPSTESTDTDGIKVDVNVAFHPPPPDIIYTVNQGRTYLLGPKYAIINVCF